MGMKIGFSFGRCVRDIVMDRVLYHDVYLIVARTAIHDSSQVDDVIDHYLRDPQYLYGLDEGKCYDIGSKLYLDGKLYQPRLMGHAARKVAEDAVWMDLAPTTIGDEQQAEQVRQAWASYQLALKLTALQQPSKDAVERLRGGF